MLRRFLASFAIFSLVGTIGLHPAIAAGVLTLLGVGGPGGGGGGGALTTPVLKPFVSSNFNPNQVVGLTSNSLSPNGGAPGAFQFPPTATNSAAFYFEMIVNPALNYGFNGEFPFAGLDLDANTNPGQPAFLFNRQATGGVPGSWWFLNPGMSYASSGSATPGSNYAAGIYAFTVPSGCIRSPSGVWQGGSNAFQQTDPGLGCPTGTISLTAAQIAANIPGSGAQQATGTAASPAQAASTCTPNSPSAGYVTVTTALATAHGVQPGLTYALGGFPSPFATNYTALPGTTSTVLVGDALINSGSCGGFTGEGTALSGTGASIHFPGISTTSPYNNGSTGIATHNGQHICGWIVENGADSNFPGSQAIAMVDSNGNPLTGSPALVPFLNQGLTSTYTASAAGSTLTVSALPSFTITGATYSGTTGYVTFTVSSSPGFVPGSEFTVSGISPSGFNRTYVAVAGTSGTTIVGEPLTTVAGVPQPFGSSPGTYSSGGSFVSVILPGQEVADLSAFVVILPYGTNGTTGVGGAGSTTYALSGAVTTVSGATVQNYGGFYYTFTGTARTAASIGDFISSLGAGFGGSLGNVAMLWGTIPTQAGGAPSTADLASICTKQTDIQTYAAAHSLTVNSYYPLNDLGISGDASNATIRGYVTNSGGTSATLNVVSTYLGSLALGTGTETANLTGPGLPVASPVTIPLTTSSSSTYPITPNTTAAIGSIGAPITFAVGAWKPALPAPATTAKGYIDTTAGVSTLHVTSFDDGAAHKGFASFTGTLGTTFTAKIDNGSGSAGNILTISAPGGSPPGQNAYAGVGMIVSPLVGSGAFTPATVTALGTGTGYTGTYTVGGSPQFVTAQIMFGSCATPAPGCLPGPPTSLTASGTQIGSIPVGSVVTDGGASLTGPPLLITGFVGGNGGSIPYTYTVSPNYYPSISADTTMWATTSTVIPGEYIQNASITNPVKVTGYSGACGIAGASNGLLGCYTLSGSPNASGAVGAGTNSSTWVVFTGNTITDGGAIAPGPALTLDDNGPGIVFPVSFGTNTGALALSGKYNATALGGTPSGIQALVSNNANGPPLTGCTPCNWGALTGTVSGGVWKGTISGIPGNGPYFVSVRAANGTSYAVSSQSIRVGGIWPAWGNGQVQSEFSPQTGLNTSWFSGLLGGVGTGSGFSGNEAYLTGPPLGTDFVPAQSNNNAGDRFGVAGNSNTFSEAVVSFDQKITNSFNVPASLFYAARDGVGMGVYALGNVTQTQTVGSGTGSQTVWCSAAKFCGNVDVGSPLTFNAASLTGVWFTGSVVGSTLTVTTRTGGALEPGLVLGATGSPTVIRCLTSCTTPLSIDGSTWLLSSSAANGATGALRADPPPSLIPFGGTTTPWPNFNIQAAGSFVYAFAGFGQPLIKAGSFKITDTTTNTILCQDTTTYPPPWNQTGSTSLGAGCAGFVNFQGGDYQAIVTSAPANGDALVASWTNIISPEAVSVGDSRPQNLDSMGDGTPQSGFVSSRFSKFPGGVSGQMWVSQGSDNDFFTNANGPNNGYEFGAIGYSQMMSWLFGVKFPALVPGSSPSAPFLTTDIFRLEGPVTIYNASSNARDNISGQWAQDVTTSSTFSGTVSANSLLLTSPAVGPMWEGEVLGCVTYSVSTCPMGPLSGAYIKGLTGGVWGASGSTYSLSRAPGNFTNQPLQNAVFYSGSGPTLFLGTQNDVQEYWNGGLSQTVSRGIHPGAGPIGGRRSTSRWAAMIWCHNGGNCDDPKVDRVKTDTPGLDAAALASPGFDVGSGTYNENFASATWSPTGNTVTIPGGLAAHARPFVVGMNTFCSGCNSGLIITSVSVPPTQSTVAGQGQVGNTFTFTVQNASGQPIGGSGSGLFAGGCAGTSGTGSNCINIAVSINVSGATALDTCGANNLNGSAPNYALPSGMCHGNGIGEIVRAFRIGTAQQMNGDGGSIFPAAGSVFDDGVDLATGQFNQSAAFTCNIVAANVVQCIKGPAYTSGVFTGVGQWASGLTYISYGDSVVVAGRIGSLLGYVGGQSFPFTPGSGMSPNSTITETATCSTIQGGGSAPKFDVTVAGGSIVNVAPSSLGSLATGLGIGSTCSVPMTGFSGGTLGSINTIIVSPAEGSGGIGDYRTDNNTTGMFLYDNSCGGNGTGPLGTFFGNGMGGCFETGLPMRPFGGFQGEGVSG